MTVAQGTPESQSESRPASRPESRAESQAESGPQSRGARELAAAVRLFASERYDEAAASLEALAKANPKDPRPLALLGAARLQLHQYDVAKGCFEAALALDPADDRARIGLADALEKLGKLDDAAAALEVVAAREAPPVEGLFAAGQLAAKRQLSAKAKEWLRRALEREPWGDLSPAAHYTLSQIASAERDPAEAKKERELYEKKFHWAEKRSALERRLSAEPGDAPVRRALATLYREAGDGKKAAAILEPGARANPKDPRWRVEIAESLLLAGDRKGAGRAVAEALSLDRRCVAAYRVGVELALEMGELPLAFEGLKRALDLDPAATSEPALRDHARRLEDMARAAGNIKIADATAELRKRLGT